MGSGANANDGARREGVAIKNLKEQFHELIKRGVLQPDNADTATGSLCARQVSYKVLISQNVTVCIVSNYFMLIVASEASECCGVKAQANVLINGD